MPRRAKKPSQARFYMHIAGRLACAGLAYALAPIARHLTARKSRTHRRPSSRAGAKRLTSTLPLWSVRCRNRPRLAIMGASASAEPQDGQAKRALGGLKSGNFNAIISRRSRQWGQSQSRRFSSCAIDTPKRRRNRRCWRPLYAGGLGLSAVPALRKWNERPGQVVIIGAGFQAPERAV
jgi:hypothetical protein